MEKLLIRKATETDVPVTLEFIRLLADYEKMQYQVFATETILKNELFKKSMQKL